MTLAFGKRSLEEQEKITDQQSGALNRLTDDIKKDLAFQHMMDNEGEESIAEKIIIGKASLTNAFMEAQDQLEAEKNNLLVNQPNPNRIKNLTVEDKKNMWAGRDAGQNQPNPQNPKIPA